METLEIDLRDYTNIAHSYWGNTRTYPEYGLRENGLKAAKDHQILKKVVKVDLINISAIVGVQVNESFMKALLGPCARKIGPENLLKKLSFVYLNQINDNFSWEAKRYLGKEVNRIEERAKKKKAVKDPEWMGPQWFFVPEIGTQLRLVERWYFKLYRERRNSGLYEQLGTEKERSTYPRPSEISILQGSILKVDRIYVRKGVKDYSSLTFNLQKGARVEFNGTIYTVKGARFWAKLSDVNLIYASVDKNSLPVAEVEDDKRDRDATN